MEIIERPSWVMSDGQVFFNRRDAEKYKAHVMAVANATEYGKVLEHAGFTPRQISTRLSAIVGYLEWRDNGTAPTLDDNKGEGGE